MKEGRLTVDQRRKELYENGEIDEVFLRNTYSSDSEAESPLGKPAFSVNSGLHGVVSPIKKRGRGNSFKKGQVVRTHRNSFQLAVSDSEDSNTDDDSGKKVLNLNSGNLRFQAIE